MSEDGVAADTSPSVAEGALVDEPMEVPNDESESVEEGKEEAELEIANAS